MSVEIETHHEAAHDGPSRLIGLQTAILAILLSIFTILAHRAHTDTIVAGNEASNDWAHYQAKRIRAYQIEMNTGLIKLMAPHSVETTNTLVQYAKETEKYKIDLDEIKSEADTMVREETIAHHRASFYDLSEGILEVAMILSSLYFLTRKRFFPVLGLVMGLGGVVVGIMGIFLR